MIAEPLIAHRGCALLRPENTLAAMTFTRTLGIGWVEIDANLLGDGTPIMFHDDVLDRLTPASGHLRDQRWQTVCDLDVGSHFGAEYHAERIPTLVQAITHIRDLGLGLNLEIKVYPHFTAQQIVTAVIAVLDDQWLDYDRLIISSFSTEALQLLRAQRPHWPLGHLCEAVPDHWPEIANDLSLVSLHCDQKQLQAAQARAIKAAGLELYSYTVNDPARGRALRDMGVDGLITDNPLLFGTS